MADLQPRPPKPNYPPPVHHDVRQQRERDIRAIAIVLRLASAFTLSTFFQPDEYYQTLEPAWSLAFGQNTGAWITWVRTTQDNHYAASEWTHGLRSSIHPLLLSAVYYGVNSLCEAIILPPTFRIQLLLFAPKVAHAGFAAILDYYTWRLAERIFGKFSKDSTAAIALSLLSPWHWFAGTRALTNGLEASLTAIALVYWPWNWLNKDCKPADRQQDLSGIKYSVCFAAVATILRPTNLLIWGFLGLSTFAYASLPEIMALVQDGSVYGTVVIALCNGLDRLYYGDWCFPAARFLNYNLTQDLAVFYGQNRVDYYFTEGLPILLTLALPFALTGIILGLLPQYNSPVRSTKSPQGSPLAVSSAPACRALAVTVLGYAITLSFISHKEVRFLYPLLPIVLVLAARPLTTFFAPFPWPNLRSKRILLLFLTATSIAFTVYITYIHNRGLISVLAYLRNQFVAINADALILGTSAAAPLSLFARLSGAPAPDPLRPMSVAFLMPCHSTPWRSHLVYPELRAWALTCEPPIGLTGAERTAYLDEADVFYADPRAWLRQHMNMRSLPAQAVGSAAHAPWDSQKDWTAWDQRDAPAQGLRPWPRYLVFFEQLEADVTAVVNDVGVGMESRYRECWRGFNTHWHDDWRRQGDVVVYCVDGSVDEQPILDTYREALAKANEERWAQGLGAFNV